MASYSLVVVSRKVSVVETRRANGPYSNVVSAPAASVRVRRDGYGRDMAGGSAIAGATISPRPALRSPGMGTAKHEADLPSAEQSARERARRIAAMLKRWEGEDTGDEPAWDVDDIAPLRFNSGAPARS